LGKIFPKKAIYSKIGLFEKYNFLFYYLSRIIKNKKASIMKKLVQKITVVLFVSGMLLAGCQQEQETEEMFDKVSDKVEKISAVDSHKDKKNSPD
jgi:hypothetical protein